MSTTNFETLTDEQLGKLLTYIAGILEERKATVKTPPSANQPPIVAATVAEDIPPPSKKQRTREKRDSARTVVQDRRPLVPPDTVNPPANQPPTRRGSSSPQIIAQTTEPKAVPSVPPFIVRDKQKWTTISAQLKERNVNYTKATNSRDGITVYTATEEDYRTMYKALQDLKTQFHTYQLRSEKSLRVVMRGIIQDITTEEIANDLKQQKYEPTRITRLTGRDKRPAPLVMIELDRKYKSIYNLQTCCGLTITIEAKKTQAGQRQCHKCQMFGHIQANCHAEYRCMKCAETHSTHECPKPKTVPAKCVNCEGEHTAAYYGCPQNPNRTLPKKPTLQPTPQTSGRSYGEVAGTRRATAASCSFGNILGEMMTTFYATNPSKQQMLEFVEHSSALYNLYANGNRINDGPTNQPRSG